MTPSALNDEGVALNQYFSYPSADGGWINCQSLFVGCTNPNRRPFNFNTVSMEIADDFRTLSLVSLVFTSGNIPDFQLRALVSLPNGLTLTSPVPVPTALPLFATGLGVLGLLGWRRKRKAAAKRTPVIRVIGSPVTSVSGH